MTRTPASAKTFCARRNRAGVSWQAITTVSARRARIATFADAGLRVLLWSFEEKELEPCQDSAEKKC